MTLEGTLRVDRSAPDDGADNLIVSGDVYSRLPAIGPTASVLQAAAAGENEGDAPTMSLPMSMARALSTVDQPLVPQPIRLPMIAYLRSAAHELTHTLNQIHQEQETTADNSIMTTTPSVAHVLGGPTTGEPGVFPDQIRLAVNTTVHHHLNPLPDPVIVPADGHSRVGSRPARRKPLIATTSLPRNCRSRSRPWPNASLSASPCISRGR